MLCPSLCALHVEHTQAAIEAAKESGMADMEMDEYKSLCDIKEKGRIKRGSNSIHVIVGNRNTEIFQRMPHYEYILCISCVAKAGSLNEFRRRLHVVRSFLLQ